MRLFQSLHDALELHLPSIDEESDRQEALVYLRGLKSILEARADTAQHSAIRFGNTLTRRRIALAVAATNSRQIADARRIHRQALTVFFGDTHHDID